MEKSVILIALFICNAAGQKTITISSPKCNLDMTATIPVTECCCPTPTDPTTTVPTTPKPSTNVSGKISGRTAVAPSCPAGVTKKYPGQDCKSYYVCTNGQRTMYFCDSGSVYSVLQSTCVKVSSFTITCVD